MLRLRTLRLTECGALMAAVCLMAVSCEPKLNKPSDQVIVVDGFIEDGGEPVVIVTGSASITSDPIAYTSLRDYIFNWAKVTVTGPEGEIVLTGQESDKYFPPYIYTTHRMKGKAGQTYSLKVEYGGQCVEATTSIPEPASLSGLRAEKQDHDSYVIRATINDNPDTKDYFHFFVKVEGKDSTYRPSFMGIVNDEILLAEGSEVDINQGMQLTANGFEPHFKAGDRVFVKLANMDEVSYLYWNDYENLFAFSNNPIFPSYRQIKSNISGGLGLWAGYGSRKYFIVIPEE